MPKQKKLKQRSVSISLRLEKYEKQLLVHAAKIENIPLSVLIRDSALRAARIVVNNDKAA